MMQRVSRSKTDRWWLFANLLLLALIIGSMVGGRLLSAKCIIMPALAAAQRSYFLAQAEGVLSSATDVVALMATNLAVFDM
jgi:hypothetical protein